MFKRRRYTQGKRYNVHVLHRDVELAVQQGLRGPEDHIRVASVILDGLGCATADAAWNRLCADFRAGRRGTLWSGMRAAKLLRLMYYLGCAGRLSDQDARVELCEEALRHGPKKPAWQAWVVLCSASRGMHMGVSSPAALQAELGIIERAREAVPVGTPERQEFDLARMFVLLQLGLLGGADDFDAAIEELAALQGSLLPAEVEPLSRAVLANFRIQQALSRGDEDAIRRQLPELDAVLETLPPDIWVRLRVEAWCELAWEVLQALRAARGKRRDPAGDRPRRSADSVRNQARSLPAYVRLAVLCETGVARLLRAVATDDPAEAREALSLLGEGLELMERDDGRWSPYAYLFGWGHFWIAGREGLGEGRPPGSFDQGIDWLTHAVRACEGPEHPLWADMSYTLALALRAKGDLDAARCTGMNAVSETARNVLLQSGTSHAAEGARWVGQRAVEVAAWCLADGELTDAVRTLEAGRGLTLHAATVWLSVSEMLDALGRPELAAEWRATGAVVPGSPQSAALAALGMGPALPSSRLRRQVLEVLENSPLRERTRDVPTLSQIGRALRAMGRTALVYLLPRTERQPGAALLVTSDGGLRVVRLPELNLAASEFVNYHGPGRIAGGPPEAGEVPPHHDSGTLEELCDWAGRAVMEPLLRAVSGPEQPSLVLVPMAKLGAVPWHAARLPGSGRYACQEARISYTPSARLLCEVAERPATGMRQVLVVGDPERNLPYAREEADAVLDVFYRGAERLGPGTATPEAVKDWLGRQWGGVLHLACHGAVEEGERYSSYLRLADERSLPAEELTEGTARYQGLELVALAACRSNVSGHGWDEAYSMATAFLVAGARSVVGSLWPVPDDTTSLLMYMMHHYLSQEGQPPETALRSAQLWMLDAGRVPPPGMPEALADRVDGIDTSDLVGWAGFTHLGW